MNALAMEATAALYALLESFEDADERTDAVQEALELIEPLQDDERTAWAVEMDGVFVEVL